MNYRRYGGGAYEAADGKARGERFGIWASRFDLPRSALLGHDRPVAVYGLRSERCGIFMQCFCRGCAPGGCKIIIEINGFLPAGMPAFVLRLLSAIMFSGK